MDGQGHDFEREFVSESVSETDSDTDKRFFGTSDTGLGYGHGYMIYRISENLGHGLGHGQFSDMGVRSSLI